MTSTAPQKDADVVDVVIVGAGLAGVALAQALTAAAPAMNIALIHHANTRAGSSAPSALLHFAPGRSFDVSKLQARAFATSVAWLHRQDPRFFQMRPLLRPTAGLAGERLSASLSRAAEAIETAGVQVDVVNTDRIQALLPGAGFDEAFEVAPSYAVDLALLLAAERDRLAATVVAEEVVEVAPVPGGFSITFASGVNLQATRVVFACGAAMTRWFDIAGPIEAGELARGYFAAGAQALVSAGGVHACPHVRAEPTGEAWVGATRFPLQTLTPTTLSSTLASMQYERDGIAREELETKLRPHVPGFSFVPEQPWLGVRLVGPDRRPVVGELSTPGAFVLAGFGATGLLWAPACAAWLAAHLVDGAPVPSVLFARRSGSTNDGL